MRSRNAATLLPIGAALLLLPPFILVFASPVLVAGVPLIVIYVFGVWAAIVVAAWLVARRHVEDHPDPADATTDAKAAGGPPFVDGR